MCTYNFLQDSFSNNNCIIHLHYFSNLTTECVVLEHAIVYYQTQSCCFRWKRNTCVHFDPNVNWSILQSIVLLRAFNNDEWNEFDEVSPVQDCFFVLPIVGLLKVCVHVVQYCILILSYIEVHVSVWVIL